MINGILNVYKESGYTSHDVVAKLRGILRQKKIGHTGTLDPDATGVLPVCLGKATKLCDMLTDRDKTYQAVMVLGVATDTQDMSGTILKEVPAVTDEKIINKVIDSFVGDIMQIPPMYSALKVNGRKLCDLAREGIEVERQPRPVTIYGIRVTHIETKEQRTYVTMEVDCSKGTYIRTLCHDIGEKLGCCGAMDSLVRSKAAGFKIQQALKLDVIEEMMKNGTLEQQVVPVESVFESYPSLKLTEEGDRFLYNGNLLDMTMTNTDSQSVCTGKPVKVYDSKNEFLAVYQWDDQEEKFKSIKMFL